MSIWAALAGGFVGTLVLTTVLRTASELNLTRMDLPFLLGTAVTADRMRAKAIGYAAHFVVGLVFALGYFALFAAVGRHDWWLGALFGLGQGLSPERYWLTSCCRWFTRGWERRSALPGRYPCSNRPGSCCATTDCRPPWSASWRMSRTARSSRSSSPWLADAGVLFSH